MAITIADSDQDEDGTVAIEVDARRLLHPRYARVRTAILADANTSLAHLDAHYEDGATLHTLLNQLSNTLPNVVRRPAPPSAQEDDDHSTLR